MSDVKQLSALQMDIMRIFWERGEATTSEIHRAIRPDRQLAPTTVATVIQRLAKQGVLTYRVDGRQYVYRPLISESEARTSMVADLVERVFMGNSQALVSHLIEESDITDDELNVLRNMLARHISSTDSEDTSNG